MSYSYDRRQIEAKVFPSKDALDAYLKAHPKANPSKHSVRGEGDKGKGEGKPKEKAAPKRIKRPSADPIYGGKDVTKMSQGDQRKIVDKLSERPKDDLQNAKWLMETEMNQATSNKDSKVVEQLSIKLMMLDSAIRRSKK